MAGVGYLLLAAITLAYANSVHAGVSLEPQCDQPDAQVLILGAGMSGVAAARTLHDNGVTDILILEQFNKPGGRLRSGEFAGAPIERGAQWILNNDETRPVEEQNPIFTLAQQCNVTRRRVVTPATVAYDDEGADITAQYVQSVSRLAAVLTTLQTEPSLVDELEQDFTSEAGYRLSGWEPRTPEDENAEWVLHDLGYAGSSSGGSSFVRGVLCGRASGNLGPTSYLVTDPKGLDSLATCVLDQISNASDPASPRLLLNTRIVRLAYNSDCVCALSSSGSRYCAPYAIISLPLAVQQDPTFYVPPLPTENYYAIQTQTMAKFLKVWIQFNETFWDTDVDWIHYVDRIRGREYYPRWIPIGTFLPGQPHIIQALLTGDQAGLTAFQNKETTMDQVYDIMTRIYGDRASRPVDLVQHMFINDPLFYGDYSYPTPGTTEEIYDQLEENVERMYFCGEHTSRLFRATLHGAWFSGIRAANDLLRDMRGCDIVCEPGFNLTDECSCELVDICEAEPPCQNGGTCRLLERPDTFTCDCPEGISGELCEDAFMFINGTPRASATATGYNITVAFSSGIGGEFFCTLRERSQGATTQRQDCNSLSTVFADELPGEYVVKVIRRSQRFREVITAGLTIA